MTDESMLAQLNAAYIASFLNSDVGWYDRHLAEDFVCILSDGTVLDRRGFLENTARGPNVTDYVLEQVRIRIFGDAALVHGTGRFTGKDGTRGISRYTDVYARVEGAWRGVAAQITRTPRPG